MHAGGVDHVVHDRGDGQLHVCGADGGGQLDFQRGRRAAEVRPPVSDGLVALHARLPVKRQQLQHFFRADFHDFAACGVVHVAIKAQHGLFRQLLHFQAQAHAVGLVRREADSRHLRAIGRGRPVQQAGEIARCGGGLRRAGQADLQRHAGAAVLVQHLIRLGLRQRAKVHLRDRRLRGQAAAGRCLGFDLGWQVIRLNAACGAGVGRVRRVGRIVGVRRGHGHLAAVVIAAASGQHHRRQGGGGHQAGFGLKGHGVHLLT